MLAQVSGLLHVQRAPGMLVMQAVSDGHDFNWETMDVSHTVSVDGKNLMKRTAEN